MNKLSKILKQLMAAEKINMSELARNVGLLQPVVHRLAHGQTDNPRIKTLLPIANYFFVTINQLMGEDALVGDSIAERKKKTPPKSNKIPLLNWDSVNTHKNNANGNAEINYVATDVPMSKDAYALVVHDSTMIPRFMPNTILFVERHLTPENGDFVIAKIKPETKSTFKQLFFDCGEIYLKPLNTDFKTIILESDTPAEILGVVVSATIKLKN